MSVVTRKTQKDIGNYQSKLIGPFTTRQTAILGIGIVPTALAIFIAKGLGAGVETLIVVAMVFAFIPGFLAFGQKFCHDMKPEDFVVNYYYYHYKCPRIRLYKTKTLDDILWEKEHRSEMMADTSKKSKAASSVKKKKPKQISGYRYFE